MKLLTKNRAELLKLFFTNPDRAFYMQEIGRILDKKPGIFQRTLNNLVLEGILESEYRANARYFKVNKNYPLYKELKSIIFKTIGIKGSIKEILEEIKGVRFAFIYGSYAKAKENYISDIDLVIIGNPDEDELIKRLDKVEGKLQREINYKLYSLKAFKKEVAEKEPFILEILRDKKIMLIGDENGLRKIFER
ncbi:MAG: nucleotidyltransferase domain-containing protein [Candidatus Omnitrophica bacterium]|nr:nucleotidyltransferase domain-containing protein [Candidatus Omnitrophota bacterium]